MADPTLPVQPIPGPFPPPAPRTPRPWQVGLVGAVVGALVAGLPLLLTRGGGGGGLGASKDSISAPDNVGGYTPMLKNPKVDAATIKRLTAMESVSAKNLSAAYGGAGAVLRQYSDDGFMNDFTLEAVRAESPKPFTPYIDPASLGLVKPDQDVETFGQVNCLVHYQPVNQGQQVQPEQIKVMTCERTSAHLTVRLLFGAGDAWQKPADAAALTEQAWSKLS
jgi:hypothetical protein